MEARIDVSSNQESNHCGFQINLTFAGVLFALIFNGEGQRGGGRGGVISTLFLFVKTIEKVNLWGHFFFIVKQAKFHNLQGCLRAWSHP